MGSNGTKYLGKYKGTVVNNIDPDQIGRIQAMVPDVLGLTPSSWALQCLPMAGLMAGMLSVPPIGTGVWIEFEKGDPDHPIWTGCYWGTTAEVPTMARLVTPPINGFAFQTTLQNGLVISDNPGVGITIQTASKATLMINEAGILIDNGKGATIALLGNTVSINGTALTVT
jgi:uncharacterized protein involved in type VI secretion and phage assembly